MKKAIAIMFIITALLVTGCQSGNSGSDSSPSVAATASGSEAPNPIKMRFSWWGDDSRNQATLEAIALYQQLHPHITIEGEYGDFASYYQKLLTQLASKTAPDIVQVDYKWVGDLIRQGKPFTNIHDLSDIIDLTEFPMKAIEGYVGEGDYLIGVPAGANGRGLAYNTEFFDKYGIAAGNDWTWDRILEEGAKVNQQDKDAHLMFFQKDSIVYLVQDWIKQKHGVNMFTDDYEMVFNEQDLADVFSFIAKMVDTGTVPPFEEMVPYEGVFPDQVPNWLDGKWGLTILSASNLPPVIASSSFKLGTMRTMVHSDAKDSAITVAPSQVLSVYDESPHKLEAAKFINWLLTDEQALNITKATRGIPIYTPAQKLMEEQGVILPEVSSMIEQAVAQPGSAVNAVTLNTQLVDITRQYIYQVGYKKLTPEEAAQKLVADYTKVLDELKP